MGSNFLNKTADAIDNILRDAVNWCPDTISPWVVHNGKGYEWKKNSFDCAWDRLMKKSLNNGLQERFTAHDLKAKSISDDPDDAQIGAGHVDPRVTERVYRRKPATVKPIK